MTIACELGYDHFRLPVDYHSSDIEPTGSIGDLDAAGRVGPGSRSRHQDCRIIDANAGIWKGAVEWVTG